LGFVLPTTAHRKFLLLASAIEQAHCSQQLLLGLRLARILVIDLAEKSASVNKPSSELKRSKTITCTEAIMETIWQDLRFGARMLFKHFGFALIALLTLALGIGANTAIFSVVNAVLLQPLPFKESDRLVLLWSTNVRENNLQQPSSFFDFYDFKQGQYVSANIFSMLGVAPQKGRAFRAEEDVPNGPPSVIISHSLWQRYFNSDPEIIGKMLRMDGNQLNIVGVMPAGFHFLERVELWVPAARNPIVNRGRSIRLFSVVGRLKPHVTVQQAGAEMATIARRLEQQYPDTNSGVGARLVPLHEQVTGNVRPALILLLGAVGLILLIACANVANLLHEDPIGKRLRTGVNPEQGNWQTVVGVVGNVRHLGLEIEPRPELYFHTLTSPPFGPFIAIRAKSDPKSLVTAVRSEVRSIDGDAVIANINTMEELVSASVAGRRFSMFLLGIFAAIALALAAIGIYGVISYSVAQRTNEIGIRMALGAKSGDVIRMVLREGMMLSLFGVGVGLIAMFTLTRLMMNTLSNLLFSVRASDPIMFASVAALLTLIALVACYIPARRATKVDPMVALRCE
jgi:hypothetical protein